MGCGSSRSAVAIINQDNITAENHGSKKILQTSDSINISRQTSEYKSLKTIDELFQVTTSSKSSLKNEKVIEELKNNKNTNDHVQAKPSSIISISDRQSISTIESKKPSTAGSEKSGDSGVFEDGERQSSAKSHSSHSEVSHPSSGKTSSARRKLLRIDDQTLENRDCNTFNIVERPKTRSGNVAFDLLIDAPETGNMKKKPDLLPAIEQKKKRSKKIKSREEIERKMQEVEERRKIQEVEKKMKAKQFQHLAIHTTVEPFQASVDEESTLENKE